MEVRGTGTFGKRWRRWREKNVREHSGHIFKKNGVVHSDSQWIKIARERSELRIEYWMDQSRIY